MDEKELKLILQEGESYKVEFKESISEIDKEIVAFANASGGTILIGVSDDNKIKGINITNKLKSQIQDIANNCKPSIKIFLEEIRNILIVNVGEGKDKPYQCSSGFYKRIGTNSQKLKRDEIVELFKSEGKVRFDEMIDDKFEYPKDFDSDKFNKFLELANITKNKDYNRILTSFGVAEKQEGKFYFNNAGVLFFAKEPQTFVPWSVFTVVLFKNEAGTDIIDRKEITGSLFEIVEEVMKFVRLYAKVAYKFSMGGPKRENVYEYPFDAVREAVINSVMHRYYFEHGHNNILRFLPRSIKIENYWKKPSNFVVGKTVFRRNPIIADLFSRIHFGEKIGTGFGRIREICKKENAPFPRVEFDENYFYLTFKQSSEYLELSKGEKTPQKTPQKTPPKTITQLEQNILNIINNNPQTTRNEIAEKLNISPETVKEYLTKLKEKKFLKRVGPDKGGYWKVIEKNA